MAVNVFGDDEGVAYFDDVSMTCLALHNGWFDQQVCGIPALQEAGLRIEDNGPSCHYPPTLREIDSQGRDREKILLAYISRFFGNVEE